MIKFHKDGSIPTNNEVFVFGSNLAGIHGAGAAKLAVQKYRAVYGNGVGWMNEHKSYAIPTKDINIRTLPLSSIEEYIRVFVRVTNNDFLVRSNEPIKYFVTRIGCGLAGFKDSQIAPLFIGARNCSFAEQWKTFIIKENI